jgi:hypothetical protein
VFGDAGEGSRLVFEVVKEGCGKGARSGSRQEQRPWCAEGSSWLAGCCAEDRDTKGKLGRLVGRNFLDVTLIR